MRARGARGGAPTVTTCIVPPAGTKGSGWAGRRPAAPAVRHGEAPDTWEADGEETTVTDPSAQQQPGGPDGRPSRPRIVVGVDGSDHSRAALAWALAEADRRSAAVDAVATYPVDVYSRDAALIDQGHIDRVRTDTETRARAFVEEVLAETAADAPVTLDVRPGPPAAELVRHSEDADLLVVGSRGRGAVRSTVLGSVALHCSVHAHCPVVVVRGGGGPPDDRVVVGLDDSPAGRDALVRAAEEARRRGGRLEVVVAGAPVDTWTDVAAVRRPTDDELREDAAGHGRRVVSEVLGDAAGLAVRVVAEVGAADEVLVRHAEGAGLLVVGSRSRSRIAGMVLGSVALRTVVHATCPVMVVRPTARREEPAGAPGAGQGR